MTPAEVFPPGGARVIVYALYNARGHAGPYVLRALRGLRPHARSLIVVANGALDEDSRRRLGAVADHVVVRENRGFDIGAHQDVLRRFGDEISRADELLLTNDTWFGPIGTFDALFERMDSVSTDFWGVTDHARVSPHPLTGTGFAEQHLQSYWIAVRRRMLRSAQWRSYWAELPMAPTYTDAVLAHETRFTGHFAQCGFAWTAAFPAADFGSVNPSLFAAAQLIEAGSPLLKRRTLFQWPPQLDQHAAIGRDAVDAACSRGYPEEEIWASLAPVTEPKVLHTDGSLLEILPLSAEPGSERSALRRIAVIAHIYYPEMTNEILTRAAHLPGEVSVFVTTADAERAGAVAQEAAALREHFEAFEIRTVESNDGRDQSAFLITTRDVLQPGRFDLVVKLHSKRTPQDGWAVGTHFRGQQLDNLLATPGYAERVVALFAREPGLGLVFPPTIHIGYPTLGHGWWANRPDFDRMCARLGIGVPADHFSPLAPYGSMFVARPEALALLVDRPWTPADFAGAVYGDGSLTHVLERIPVYAAAELGYHSRTVMTEEYAAISYTALDGLYDRFAARVPGELDEQLDVILRAGHFGTGRAIDLVRVWFRLNHPMAGTYVRRMLWPALIIRRALRRRGR